MEMLIQIYLERWGYNSFYLVFWLLFIMLNPFIQRYQPVRTNNIKGGTHDSIFDDDSGDPRRPRFDHLPVIKGSEECGWVIRVEEGNLRASVLARVVHTAHHPATWPAQAH